MYNSLQGVCPYPTTSWEELADMPIGKLADPSMCALFLWATGPLIGKAIELMEHWGFSYKTVHKVWRKTNADGTPVCTPGWWSRSSCEFLLVGTKGSNILKHKTTGNERQEYASVRQGHSAKPAAITDAVANFLDVPGPRIELWARTSHPLFDSWGEPQSSFSFSCSSPTSASAICMAFLMMYRHQMHTPAMVTLYTTSTQNPASIFFKSQIDPGSDMQDWRFQASLPRPPSTCHPPPSPGRSPPLPPPPRSGHASQKGLGTATSSWLRPFQKSPRLPSRRSSQSSQRPLPYQSHLSSPRRRPGPSWQR